MITPARPRAADHPRPDPRISSDDRVGNRDGDNTFVSGGPAVTLPAARLALFDDNGDEKEQVVFFALAD
jgi:hypothetical protein